MSDKIDEIVVELIKSLKCEFTDFKGIYLFGLFLDGQMHQDEDIELVAIFDNEQDKTKREQIWRIVGKIEEIFNVFIDLHPLTAEALKKEEELYEEITTEGIFFNAELF
ncbi:nucleotidyltransferase domain-containing protein [bacterium]|nr:nucleotidyltransferase domain-containing protein [bacterium]